MMMMEQTVDRKQLEKAVLATLALIAVLVIAQTALAFTSGVAADTGYAIYDFVVNKLIKGPIGATAGVVMVGAGCVAAVMGKLSGAVWPLIGGGAFIGAPGIVTSMGMTF